MIKNDVRPLDKAFLTSCNFCQIYYREKETIPVFVLPYGFNELSLFQIAQYYDGTAQNYFQNMIFSPTSPPFSQQKTIDYSNYFSQVLQNQLPNDITIGMYDRFFDSDLFLSLYSLGVPSFKAYKIPKGNEDGIVHILSNSRDYTRSHIFSLSSSPFSSIPLCVHVTIGQPYLLNNIISEKYANVESVNAREAAIHEDIANLKLDQFQIDWALVSIDGYPALILCRPPQFIRISDNNLLSFDSVYDAFKNSFVYMVNYRHSKFINNVGIDSISSSSEAAPCRPINSDFIFCKLLKEQMSKDNSFDFLSYLIYSLRFPSFFLIEANFEPEIALAASVCIDNGRPTTYFIEGINTEQTKLAIQEYYRFCFWLRSLISVMKAILAKDVDKVGETILACFKALPYKNRYIMVSTILFITDTMQIFKQHRRSEDEFFIRILKIFKHVFGDDFDQVLSVQKWEIPRSIRNHVINVDSCVKMFYSKPFKTEKITIPNVIRRFTKYYLPLKEELFHNIDPPKFRLCQSYIDFLKLQVFEKTITI
ncbi:hypothetical protein TRFO_12875 [Tritrichomonas foetus]|uniref:Uncharacterized protein n=1 Tax=Tritrichomonas foetus TaxID=1144522 RepID=A0A1J4L4E6_9EUKA|nr:hypothetical protein TRFO_12875 [Tritrichomonas foetus]|eukprot:OHT16805.1 hypothetical protein TRFO_12875 [Tritrichomonas foetus]